VGVAGSRRFRSVCPASTERNRGFRIANRELLLVLANYGRTAAQIVTVDGYVPIDDHTSAATKEWTVPPRSLKILRRGT